MHRIGIYPGTFDPVHKGHIDFALSALRHCQLDAVYFLPETNPRAKSATALSHRIAMLACSTKDDQPLKTIVAPDERFTVGSTFPWLEKTFRGAQLTLLMGSDVAANLGQWEGIEILLSRASFAIRTRNQDQTKELESAFASLKDRYAVPVRATFVPDDPATKTISSTLVRSGELHGIHPAAASYIHGHGLYNKNSAL